MASPGSNVPSSQAYQHFTQQPRQGKVRYFRCRIGRCGTELRFHHVGNLLKHLKTAHPAEYHAVEQGPGPAAGGPILAAFQRQATADGEDLRSVTSSALWGEA